MKTEIHTRASRIIELFNEITGRRFRLNNKAYLKAIENRFKEGYTEEQMREVIQVKTLEWGKNPTMSVHLNPETIFRPSNFEKYINQVIAVKQNPQLYKQYYEQLNQKQQPTDNRSAFSKIDAMFGSNRE